MAYIAYDGLTWPEAGEIGRRPDVIGLIPTGAVEQHGPHLPLSTDVTIAHALARSVADHFITPLLVTPVVPAGLSDHHLAFPGTVTIDETTFAAIISAYIDALSRVGVRSVALISAHGGNYAALQRLSDSWAKVTPQVLAFSDVTAVAETMLAAARAAGFSPARSDLHAGLLETSMMLAVTGPESVADDLEAIGGFESDSDSFLDTVLADGIGTVSSTGVLGRPAGATPALGETVIHALAGLLAEWIGSVFPQAVRVADRSET